MKKLRVIAQLMSVVLVLAGISGCGKSPVDGGIKKYRKSYSCSRNHN